MNISQTVLIPEDFDCEALSKASLVSHFRLYAGYVEKYQELTRKLQAHRRLGPAAASFDAESLKTDITFALGAIKNHALFFENLKRRGEAADEPAGDLAAALVKSFHSVPQYLIDLKQTAQRGRGWAWTAYDLDNDFLFNYEASGQNGIPVWNSIPILAIDLFGHAYFYDYGNNRLAYIEAIMQSLDWRRIAARLADAIAIRNIRASLAVDSTVETHP